MNRNFFVIFKYSLLDKFKAKSFKVLFVLLLLLSAAAVFVPQLLLEEEIAVDSTGSTSSSTIGVISEDESNTELFTSLYSKIGNSAVDTVSVEEAESKKYDYVVDIDNSTVYLPDTMSSNTNLLIQLELVLEKYQLLKESDIELTEIEYVVYEGETSDTHEAGVYFITYGIKIITYFILIYGTSLLTPEIIEEKSSRQLEVVLSTVKPSSHMLAKIASMIVYLLSLPLIFAVGMFASLNILPMIMEVDGTLEIQKLVDLIFSDLPTNFVSFAIIMLLLFIVTILLFLTIVLAVASSYNSIEDLQSASTVSMLVVIASFFVALFVTDLETLKLLAYFPILNFFVLPDLLLTDSVSTFQSLIYIAISTVTLVIAVIGCSKFYRYSVLNYSTKGIFKMIKAMRQ